MGLKLAVTPAVEAFGLSKRFGSVVALDAVDLRVEPGSVCGLIGPNGAGKTTLLRLLLRLVSPDAGRMAFFGRQPALAAGLDDVAGFVEEPRFYPYLSARRTLELLATLDGGRAQPQVDDLLELVGLDGKAADAAGWRVLDGDAPAFGTGHGAAREPAVASARRADDGPRSNRRPARCATSSAVSRPMAWPSF